jgi:dihydropteroate synthase
MRLMAVTMAATQTTREPTTSASKPGAASWLIDQRRGITVSRPAGIMGILNVTPDSFSDGGLHHQAEAAIAAGLDMVAAGAQWLDVGGESSRPGALPISGELERERVIPVIAGLRSAGVKIPISIDTTKASVAAAAMEVGASAINDISAGADPDLFAVAARHICPLILMHMRGTPSSMQRDPTYADVVATVSSYLRERLLAAEQAGVNPQQTLIDPGIGFGKTVEHNLALLRSLRQIETELGRPIVLGISRKSFIPAVLAGHRQNNVGANGSPNLSLAQRDSASHVLHGLLAGQVALLRVHDVAGAVAAVRLHQAMNVGETHAL